MKQSEAAHSVWLHGKKAGVLHQRGDHTRFVFSSSYLEDPDRPVLGLYFEQNLIGRHASSMRVPVWFSNLLPEGRLREWIAADRGVSSEREMELLVQVGNDLPGAAVIAPGDQETWDESWIGSPSDSAHKADANSWRFSLAGVAMKFSMLAENDRFTMPATGAGGDWIVKLPDNVYPDVPLNEYAMMELARLVGIEVPDTRLVHRDEIVGVPAEVWPKREEWAYACARFDRPLGGGRVHIEDLAQVRGVYPDNKYMGNYETVAALLHRGWDTHSLQEFSRRLALNVLISNGDAHLKNWSLIYRDQKVPSISPAYDIVSTRYYMGSSETLGMKFAGSNRFDSVRLRSFERLDNRLQAEANLVEVAGEVVGRVSDAWRAVKNLLPHSSAVVSDIESSIRERLVTLRK